MIRFRLSTLSTAAVVVAAITAGCQRNESRRADSMANVTQCGDEVRGTVDELGHRMRLVSVLGPDSIVRRELNDAYGTLVSAPLLQTWQARPGDAPGRRTSNPWPVRIDIRDVEADSGGCRVEGNIVMVTTADTTVALDRQPVTLVLHNENGWRVTEYRTSSEPRTSVRDSSIPTAI